MEYHELCPDAPDGLRVQVYNEDGTNNILNVAPEGDIVRMRPGEHSLLLYNNDTEYIVFDDMNSFASAKATTRTRTRASYAGNPYMENTVENTVNAPDMLYGNYMENYTAERKIEADELPVTMHPLVFTYLVRYEFSHGLEYVALARGALAGMAGAVWLNSGRTSEEAATILYDCSVEELLHTVSKVAREGKLVVEKTFSYAEGSVVSQIRSIGKILEEDYRNEGIYIKAEIPREYEYLFVEKKKQEEW